MRTGQQERSEEDTGLEAGAGEKRRPPSARDSENRARPALERARAQYRSGEVGPEVEFEILRDLELGF